MGVLREMDRRSSWLNALGREPYMKGEKKFAEMLGRPMDSQCFLSSYGDITRSFSYCTTVSIAVCSIASGGASAAIRQEARRLSQALLLAMPGCSPFLEC